MTLLRFFSLHWDATQIARWRYCLLWAHLGLKFLTSTALKLNIHQQLKSKHCSERKYYSLPRWMDLTRWSPPQCQLNSAPTSPWRAPGRLWPPSPPSSTAPGRSGQLSGLSWLAGSASPEFSTCSCCQTCWRCWWVFPLMLFRGTKKSYWLKFYRR